MMYSLLTTHISLMFTSQTQTTFNERQKVKSNMSSESSSKGSSSSKKKTGNKKGGTPKTSTADYGVSLVRNSALGMHEQTIQTGFYGPRGERIRHTVSKGALQMPHTSLDIMEESSKGIAIPSSFELPGLDCVVRPFLDPALEKILVTDLFNERVAITQPPPPYNPALGVPPQPYVPTVRHVFRTRAHNRTITRNVGSESATERIRGGGNENPPTKMEIDGQSAVTNNSHGTVATSVGSSQALASAQIPSASTKPTPIAAPTASAATTTAPTTSKPLSVPSYNPPQTQHPTPTTKPVVPASATAGVPQKQPVPIANKNAPGNVPLTSTAKLLTTVKSLPFKPLPQWQQYKPGPNDETVSPANQLPPKPEWYRKDSVADIERAMLPEWFDQSAVHRTPQSYINTRERIIAISATILNRNVTNSMIRRSIKGDAGSLHRLRAFLLNFGFINEDSINDSAPTPAILRKEVQPVSVNFDGKLGDELIDAVVRESKRQKVEDSEDAPIDWKEIAKQLGPGVTSSDCERNFLSLPIKSITPSIDGVPPVVNKVTPAISASSPDKSKESLRQEFIEDLVKNSSPEVLKKVTNVALQSSSGNVKEAQSSALLGLVTSRALEQATLHENALSSVLSQLVNKRMEKLENRMAMIDDVEGILEAERVALELERRDLYTARCRHWYGGA